MRGLTSRAVSFRSSFDLAALAAVAAIIAVCAVALASVGVSPIRPTAYATNALLYATCWFGFELWPYAKAITAARPDSPLRFTSAYLRGRMPLLLRGLPLIAALIVFMPSFSAVKSSIPLFAPYAWDQTFIAADRAIFGQDAWRALQPALGFPIVTAALAVAYHCWILLIYAGGIYFAVYGRQEGRRYFAAFIALWTVGGMAMAIGFSSVGPCFAAPLLGIDTFDAQMAYLRAANESYPIMVLHVQDSLLAWHQSGQHGLGRGITAMPSMHVGLACLFWLAIRRVSKPAGRFFLAFYVLIFVGSVHLAYHYAVDGIVASLLAYALWWTSGKLTNART